MSSDDLNRSPHRLPLILTFFRRQSKTEDSTQFKEKRRIIVFGAARVGKSTIIKQFLFNQFTKRHIKTVEDFYVSDYNLSTGASLTLEILDTSGTFQFPAMRALSISHGNAFLLVFSVHDEESWKEIEELRQQIVCARDPTIPIVIAANVFEENERRVDREMVEEAVKRWGCGYIECNAKKNSKIVEVFEQILTQSNIDYDLTEAISRRQSLPTYSGKNRMKHTNDNQRKA